MDNLSTISSDSSDPSGTTSDPATSKPSDALAAVTDLWKARGTDHGWFVRNYEDAASRVTYEATPDDPYTYWFAPSEESSAEGGEVVDPFGGAEDPATARLRAFELLVLADLAETQRDAQ